MKVIIDIPDKVYSYITTECKAVADDGIDSPLVCVMRSIIDGKVIPDVHGNLLDEHVLIRQLIFSNILKDDTKCREIKKILDNSVLVRADSRSGNEDKSCSNCKHLGSDPSCNSCYDFDAWESDMRGTE